MALERIDHEAFVLVVGSVADYSTQAVRDRVHVPVKQGISAKMKCLNAGVHLNVVLRHTGGQETAFTIQDIASGGLNRLIGFDLTGSDTEPLIALFGLDNNDLDEHSDKACCDEQEYRCKTEDRISLIVTHVFA